MSTRAVQAPIVVAVDGQGVAAEAMAWVATEAATQRCPLRIVYVVGRPAVVGPYGVLLSMESVSYLARASAERVLRRAQSPVRSTAPDIEVSAVLLLGATVRVLGREAADARACGDERRTLRP